MLWANQGRLEEALSYFKQAARLGDPTGAQYAARTRQMWEQEPAPPVEPAQQAFDAFQQAGSLAAMQQAVAYFPLLRQPDFITAIEQVIPQKVPAEQQPAWQQKLGWLRQLAIPQ